MNVWITGASSGLGEALARLYASAGDQVCLSARSGEKLESLNASLAQPGLVFPCDVTDNFALTRTVEKMFEQVGELDIAILNAGTYAESPLAELNTDDARALFEVNFFSIVRSIELLVPHMSVPRPGHEPRDGHRHGHIVVISSVAGDVGLPYAAIYSASKSALNRLCESLHPELEKQGIKISVVSPGFIETPLTAKNKFPMPFLISAPEAARAIKTGIANNRFEIRFPWSMSFIMRGLARLPKGLLMKITKRMLRKDESA